MTGVLGERGPIAVRWIYTFSLRRNLSIGKGGDSTLALSSTIGRGPGLLPMNGEGNFNCREARIIPNKGTDPGPSRGCLSGSEPP